MGRKVPQMAASPSGGAVVVDGGKIRVLRQNAGLGLREMARQAGLSPAFLSGIEHGDRRPSPPVAGRIAACLGVSIADLRFANETPTR